MNPTQLPFLVEGILVLVTILLGFFLGKKGKPYGKVKLGFHLFFFLWFTVGFGFITYGLSLKSGSAVLYILVAVMGLAILMSVLTGVISGFLPAWRAARMNPVDALRNE